MQPSDFVTYSALGCQVYVAELYDDDTSEALQAQLPYDFDVSSCKSENRRRELLGIRLMLCLLFGDDARLEYDDNRPRLVVSSHPTPHISLTHSHGILAVAVNYNVHIGVDLEVFGKKIARVRERFLSTYELEHQTDDDGRLTKAHLSWTLKESLYKIVGDPVYHFRQKIEISPDFSNVRALGHIYPAHCWTTDRYALSIVTDLQ